MSATIEQFTKPDENFDLQDGFSISCGICLLTGKMLVQAAE